MTKDVIALTEKMPDAKALLMALYAGGPDLTAEALHDGAVVQLTTPAGRPLLTVEPPLLLHTPGEAARLLGDDADGDTELPLPDGPLWWTEVRAATDVPEAERLAASVAGRLHTFLGGTAWPWNTATLEAVDLTDETAALTAPDTPRPTVDVLTDKAAVVLTDRPVVPMTSWLSDVLRTAAASERALQIVTPPQARLTLPTRVALGGHPNRWVVQDERCGYYDGLSGAVLRWQEGQFAPARTADGETHAAPGFTDAPVGRDRQLLLSLRTRHAAADDLTLGGALETCWRTLTGAPPAGWGTAEPVNLPWNPRQLTELVRERAPEPSWLTAVGHPDRPALATLRVTRTTAGVEEEITAAFGYGPGEPPPLDAIEDLAGALAAEHGLITLLTQLRPARRDLSVPPRLEAPPVPVGFTLGADETERVGAERATRPPLALAPVPLGPERRPAMHYPLGDGTTATAWNDLQTLIGHLRVT